VGFAVVCRLLLLVAHAGVCQSTLTKGGTGMSKQRLAITRGKQQRRVSR